MKNLKTTTLYALGLALTAGTTFAIARQTAPKANPDSQYRLGPDSMPQEGVPKGEIKGPFVLEKMSLSTRLAARSRNPKKSRPRNSR